MNQHRWKEIKERHGFNVLPTSLCHRLRCLACDDDYVRVLWTTEPIPTTESEDEREAMIQCISRSCWCKRHAAERILSEHGVAQATVTIEVNQ